MGMYTGIRFKGYVKPEFRKEFNKIALTGGWGESDDPVFKKFGEIGRCHFIPCGALSYMPASWEQPSDDFYGEATDGFEKSYDDETGYWTFQCSLKNYEDEIESFFDILPYFIESVEHLEYYYEEWDYSQEYALVDNVITKVSDKFRNYME